MHNIIGSISVVIYFVNTVFWFIPIFGLSFLKLIPIKPWQTFVSYILDGCASNWISINNLNQNILSNTQWDVQGIEDLDLKEWYLVIANHRSWVDILVLQRVFNRQIPFLKFFLKQELIWVPFLGLAWWALDFPFMRRYSRKFLEKHPEMRGKDLEATQEACRKFKFKPVSVMNFVEGTRITEQKHKKQQSEFANLLKPKAGGMAFVLEAMQENLNLLLDVTIYYPDGTPSYWDFVCGRVKRIQVRVETLSIVELREQGIIAQDYFNNEQQKQHFQHWLNQRWQQKDQQLNTLKDAL
ncbi:acyltransferase [Planctobacterium marinum]|uniref:Acyltransferase n=1 Tax=Planctobacterium marinum TaxID=1631968 RepID=A0AA48HU21_9ALTE|nr:acyltransferase [Planctobacterium marinum]